MSRVCCECAAPVVGDGYPVGDMAGCRADDVCCSMECEDSVCLDLHGANDGRESCQCKRCWRAKRRQAHAAIARHRGPRPEVRLLGELFAAEEGE
jgi:hypothetical protein